MKRERPVLVVIAVITDKTHLASCDWRDEFILAQGFDQTDIIVDNNWLQATNQLRKTEN